MPPKVNAISFLNTIQAGKVNQAHFAGAERVKNPQIANQNSSQVIGNPNRPECRDDVHGANIYCLA